MPEHGPLFAVIGVFDGIHLGHRYLLGCLVDEARERGARPAVITFDSHPDEILVGAAPPLLLDPAERSGCSAGRASRSWSSSTSTRPCEQREYDEFVRRITSRTALAGLLMTPDAAFGHDRRGTPDAVRALGEVDGFDLVVVPPFALDGRSVRSSDIRAAIAAGDLDSAERLLGRPYAVIGDAGADGGIRCRSPLPVAPCRRPGALSCGWATRERAPRAAATGLAPTRIGTRRRRHAGLEAVDRPAAARRARRRPVRDRAPRTLARTRVRA